MKTDRLMDQPGAVSEEAGVCMCVSVSLICVGLRASRGKWNIIQDNGNQSGIQGPPAVLKEHPSSAGGYDNVLSLCSEVYDQSPVLYTHVSCRSKMLQNGIAWLKAILGEMHKKDLAALSLASLKWANKMACAYTAHSGKGLLFLKLWLNFFFQKALVNMLRASQ